MAQLTKVSIKEAIGTLTPDQQYILTQRLERLKSISHPDEIRSSLMETRENFGIDLLPWNSQLTRESKINEALQILDVSPRAMVVSCGKDSKPTAPRIKDLRIQSEDAAVAAKAKRLKVKEQKRIDNERNLKAKQENERTKYLEMLGGVVQTNTLLHKIKEIYNQSLEFQLMCIDKGYSVNNTTTEEIIDKHPEEYDKIFNTIYEHLFFVNGKLNTKHLASFFGGDIYVLKGLNINLLPIELPDLLTKTVILYNLYESKNKI
jgi:hypothetical protein